VTVTDTTPPDGSEAARAEAANTDNATNAELNPTVAIDFAVKTTAGCCLPRIRALLWCPLVNDLPIATPRMLVVLHSAQTT
jgi:hypothetical protein